jgi:glucose-6-phosphate isomerase
VTVPELTHSPSWSVLTTAAARPRPSLRQLFANDATRATRRTLRVAGLTADLSRHLIEDDVQHALETLADERGVLARLQATQAGERVNVTEDRAALHTALRLPREAHLTLDGTDVVPVVHAELDRAIAVAQQIRSGAWRGATGEQIRTIINVGIGGSDLGPRFLHEALRDHVDVDLDVRFVSNVDPDDARDAVHGLDPATTLVIIVSKSFGTTETLTNARTLRRWVVAELGESAVPQHFLAVSTNAERVAAFGIDTTTMLGFWDWVGGRYSVSSVVGISLLCAIGPAGFRSLLDGMHAMDQHAVQAPVSHNLPIQLALLQLWYGNHLGAQSQAILPYSVRLGRLPAYLQQLEMESNGKRVTLDGMPVEHDTGAIVWGQPGTDGQHAFFQLLHQGTHLVPADLIAVLRPAHNAADHHDQLLANMIAQGQALAFGQTSDEVAAAGVTPELVAHRTFPGDRPSTTILLDELTPFTLGALVALYEQKVAALAALWDINAFDQWGVELGKVLAGELLGHLVADEAPELSELDASTRALVEVARRARGRA